MNQLFVHCAEVLLEEGADPAAPGGAVTLELCGSWNHAGPCRWPHETSADWDGAHGKVRVVFLSEAEDENRARSLITTALEKGFCIGPDAKLSRWKITNQHAGNPTERELAWGAALSGAAQSSRRRD